MYLHVGKGRNIKDRDIIGIFDLDTATISSITKGYINSKQKDGCVEYADTDLPRSFIICMEKGKKEKVVLSRISSTGLKERAQLNIIEEP